MADGPLARVSILLAGLQSLVAPDTCGGETKALAHSIQLGMQRIARIDKALQSLEQLRMLLATSMH